MKKIFFSTLGILLLAGIVSASLFYFGKNKKTEAQVVVNNIQPEIKTEAMATFPVAGGKIKILFLGDLMFDRWIRQVGEKKGDNFVFDKIKNLLQGEDLVVGNLEGPITDKASVSVASVFGSKENYIFTFPPQTAVDLFQENIKLVNIGNNHILNQGQVGLASTEDFLKNAGVNFFGDPQDQKYRLKIYDLNGLKIGLVNYNQFMKNAEQQTLEDIKNAKTQGADVVILYAHWGTEFVSEPEQKIKNLAHGFVDAGADLIIGSHPHVVQTKEVYRGKAIYYSLGNFIFDQYFQSETQKGMGVEAIFDPATKKIDFKEYHFSLLKNGQTVQN
ncbi:MAG: CapA family protein [Parcubacteria group bacterium]|jgi:poly-gamma-glutamate synthesis protein (capsule biosynthesis protein)